MNKVWLYITMSKIRKFLKKRLLSILVFGCIVGVAITVFQWMKAHIEDKSLKNNINVELKTNIVSNSEISVLYIDCKEIVSSSDYVESMKSYLGGYEKYDYFNDHLEINVENKTNETNESNNKTNKSKINSSKINGSKINDSKNNDEDTNQVLILSIVSNNYDQAQKILDKACKELENRLIKYGKITRLGLKKYDKSVIKNTNNSSKYDNIKKNIIYGMIIMFAIFVIDFLLKDYISDSYEVYTYFEKVVLAEVSSDSNNSQDFGKYKLLEEKNVESNDYIKKY